MRRFLLTLLAWALPALAFADPASAVAAALADVRTLPPALAQRTRYLDLSGVPADQRDDLRQAVAFWVNSLSREAELVRPRDVSPTLLAINIDDYGWDATVYGRLGIGTKNPEPYFHQTLDVGGKKQQAGAAWVNAAGIGELFTLTQSQSPVLRADWFVYQTAIQADREAGYYDFLGLGRKESDFQKLIGADVGLSRKLKKEMAAVVARSSVTLHNRSITRVQSITGGYWLTQDYKTNTNKQNTVRLLDGAAEPPQGDATEQYGTLPNGLFAFWLGNAQGERQDSAPDFIASDGKSSSTDRRVHVGLSCVRCHLPGIQNIDDHARRLFTGDVKLVSPDYDKLKRLRQLYLSDLPGQVRRDQSDYAEKVRLVNGLTPGANAAAFASVWANYEADLSAADVAREIGCTVEHLTLSLKAQGANLDPVLAGLLQTPPLPIRREHFEEVAGLTFIATGAARKP